MGSFEFWARAAMIPMYHSIVFGLFFFSMFFHVSHNILDSTMYVQPQHPHPPRLLSHLQRQRSQNTRQVLQPRLQKSHYGRALANRFKRAYLG